MMIQRAVANIVLGVTTWSGLCVSTATSQTDVYTLFGCLHVYGFFLDLPNRDRCIGEINEFVNRHLHVLHAESHTDSTINLKVDKLSSDGALVGGIGSSMARSLNSAALVVAMKMELNKDACIEMLPQIIGDINFRGMRHVLIAAADLEMKWLEDEILRTVNMDDTNVSLYVLLKSYTADSSDENVSRVRTLLPRMTNKEIYADYKIFCDHAKNIWLLKNIIDAQSTFDIINIRNIKYFIEKDPLLVSQVYDFIPYQSFVSLVSQITLSDEQVRFLIKNEDMAILRQCVTPDRRKKILLEMVESEKDKMSLVRGIRNVFILTWDVQMQEEIINQLGPNMSRFVSFMEQQRCDLQVVRAFLDENPEYVNKAAIECVAYAEDHMLTAFKEKMEHMGGVRIVINEKTSLALLRFMTDQNLTFESFSGTGIVFTLNNEFIQRVIAADQIETLQSHYDQLNIEKYTVAMARQICEHRMHRLFDQLRKQVKNTGVIDDYIRMVENEQR